MTDRQAAMPPDAATDALEDLIAELTVCINGLEQALRRAEQLRQERRSGQSWLDLVSTETRPLIVERITHALESLNNTGSRWRREQACALLAEGVSINRIAALFGVTRQRISTLVRKRNGSVSADRPT
ncbi:MAG: helix-turn-helix domain-containing protein [Pseudonocardiaceae bacterium]